MPNFRPITPEIEADQFVLILSESAPVEPTEGDVPIPPASVTITETNGPELAAKYGGRWAEADRTLWVPTLNGVLIPSPCDYIMRDPTTAQVRVVPRAEFESQYEPAE